MPKKILTNKRAKWAEQRKGVIFTGKRLVYNASLQEKYSAKLLSMVTQMTTETTRKLINLFKSEAAETHFTTDASISSQARIVTNALADKFNDLFARLAKPTAEQMVNQADQYSKSSLHASLKDLSGGLALKTNFTTNNLDNVLKAAVSENVSLIKSISSQYLSDVQGAVMRSITSDNGLASLQPALEKYEGVTKRRAKNIALDQTRKAYNAINQSRMETLGIDQFRWIHSGGGQHPREQHIRWDGQIFSFNDLPVDDGLDEPVRPGQAPNCKCTMQPVIKLKSKSDEPTDETDDE